jgi:thiosulfate dehydrogenase
MHRIDNAAGFIKANMPLSKGNSLTDQQAWDVATFVMAHERPQDPRSKGDVAQTKKRISR